MTPTEEQLVRFVEHVADAHSWYKHLSLLNGAEFCVTQSPFAGMCWQRTSFRKYTAGHPRLHYSWKTTDEYVRRFGQLVYGWRHHPDEHFTSDGDVILDDFDQLPKFRLFPYVNGDIADVWSIHEEDFAAIQRGHPHPERDAVLELGAAAFTRDQLWQRLSNREQDLLCANVPPKSALAQEYQAALTRTSDSSSHRTLMVSGMAAHLCRRVSLSRNGAMKVSRGPLHAGL